jgi:archaemetzincin
MKYILLSILLIIINNVNSNIYNPLIKKEKLKIGITVMGNVEKNDINLIRDNLIKFYDCEVVLLPKTKLLTETKVMGTDKYSANKILENMNKIFSNKEYKILMITNYNICTDRKLNGVTHKNWSIFGLAFLNKKPCVVSTNRLKGSKEKLVKTSIHEIGHTLGIPHCENDRCILTDAKGKGSRVDNMKIWLCENCTKKIKY